MTRAAPSARPGIGLTFEIEIPDTDLAAVNGAVDLVENDIRGTVTIDGDVVEVGGALNPDYDREALDASWACNQPAATGCSSSGVPAPVAAAAALALGLARRRRRSRPTRVAAPRRAGS